MIQVVRDTWDHQTLGEILEGRVYLPDDVLNEMLAERVTGRENTPLSSLRLTCHENGIMDIDAMTKKGDKVDFVKLDQWLSFTCMTSMANLQGNLLIQGFGFNKNEIPFVHHEDKHSQSVLIRAIRHDDLSTLRVWDFHPSKSGFIVSSPKSAIKSIRHCLSYRRYAPRETMATLTNGLVNGLAEIEE